jgi:hypothetical protein
MKSIVVLIAWVHRALAFDADPLLILTATYVVPVLLSLSPIHDEYFLLLSGKRGWDITGVKE